MTIRVSDTFTDTAGKLLTAHTGETGASWMLGAGFPGIASPVIDSTGGRIKGGSGGGATAFASGLATTDGEYTEIVFDILTANCGVGGFVGAFPGSGTPARGYLMYFNAGLLKILRLDNATTFVQVGTTATVALPVANGYVGRITRTGTGASVQLDVSLNGTTLLSATDTSANRINSPAGAAVYFEEAGSDTANAHITSLILSDAAGGGGGGGTFSFTTPTDGQVIQRTGTTGTISATGTYTGSPASIEARLVQAGTSIAVSGFDWAVKVASPSGNAFAFNFASAPQNIPYNIQVRDSAVPGTVSTSGWVGVGALYAIMGQSNGWLWFARGDSTLTPNAKLRVIGSGADNGISSTNAPKVWAVPATATMNGAIAFGNRLVTSLGTIVGVIDVTWDGSGLTVSGNGGQWVPTTTAGQPYARAKAFLNTITSTIEGAVIVNGEADGAQSVTQANFYAGMTTLISAIRSDFGASIPVVTPLLGKRTDGAITDAQADTIRKAQVQKAGDTGVYRVERTDLSRNADGIHLDPTGFTNLGIRSAQAAAFAAGAATFYRGPQLTAVVQKTATTYTGTITASGGTDFTPATGITGFTAYDGASVAAISSVVRDSASGVLVTLAAAPSALPSFRYMSGTAPDVSAPLRDNSSLALPLEYNSGVQSVAGSGDVTAPTLTNPTATATGATSATGTITTNEANGTLYCLASANATEAAATVKASGTAQPVTTTGVQSVSVSSLLSSTLYYLHFLHRDAAGNDSTVANSGSFTTATLPGFVLPQYADAVRETISAISGNTLTLNGTVPQGFRAFSAAFSASTAGIPVRVEEAGTANWMLADVTLASSTQLTVTRIYAGSNGGNQPAFGSGVKSAFCVLPASQIVRRDWIDGNAYGIDPTFTNDCTAGVQQAILDAYALGVGVIRYSTGHYKLSGPLVTNVGGYNPNSQIYIPQTREGAPNKTIIIEGLSPPNFEAQILRNVPPPTNGVVFESTIMGTGIRPAVFAMVPGNDGDTEGWRFNYTNVGFDKLGIRVNVKNGANPMNALNLMEANQVVKLDMLRLDINMGLLESPSPAAVGSAGLIGPRRYNHLLFNGGCVYISGFTTGIVAFEHMCFLNVTIIGVINLISLESSDHASYIGLLSGEGFVNGIVQNGNHGLAIGQMDFEHLTIAGSWFQFQKDVKWISGSRFLTVLQCTVVVSNVGVSDASFVKDTNAVVKIVSGSGAN